MRWWCTSYILDNPTCLEPSSHWATHSFETGHCYCWSKSEECPTNINTRWRHVAILWTRHPQGLKNLLNLKSHCETYIQIIPNTLFIVHIQWNNLKQIIVSPCNTNKTCCLKSSQKPYLLMPRCCRPNHTWNVVPWCLFVDQQCFGHLEWVEFKYKNSLYLEVLFQQSLEVQKFMLFFFGGGVATVKQCFLLAITTGKVFSSFFLSQMVSECFRDVHYVSMAN